MGQNGVATGVKAVIEDMMLDGIKPDMRIIEEVPLKDRRQWEQYHMEYYRKRGHRLVNKRAVWGDGSPEVVNFGAVIYKTQVDEIERRCKEKCVPRAEMVRNLLRFALENMPM